MIVPTHSMLQDGGDAGADQTQLATINFISPLDPFFTLFSYYMHINSLKSNIIKVSCMEMPFCVSF